MLLGKPDLFTKDHYEAEKGTAPAHLCELVVHCLELVAQLGHHGLDFRFKGGNSLLLLLDEPWRFSIDVDIVTTESKKSLTELVGALVEECDAFHRWESRAPRTKPWLPLISYKLFYESVYQSPEDSYVMLDAVLEPPPYPGAHRRVSCADIYRSDAVVEVPSVSGLIGDKLLTLGPATLGIPTGKGKEAHRLKHVFDVALLSRQAHDPDIVRQSVAACMDQENRIQESDYRFPEIADDTADFLSQPLEHGSPPDHTELEEGSYIYEIAKGFGDFRQHLFRVDYTWDLFQDDCRRVLGLLKTLREGPGL